MFGMCFPLVVGKLRMFIYLPAFLDIAPPRGSIPFMCTNGTLGPLFSKVLVTFGPEIKYSNRSTESKGGDPGARFSKAPIINGPALTLCNSIWIIDFGPEKLPALSRKGALTSKLLHFVSPIKCKTIETSLFHVNNNSFTDPLIIGAFEKRVPGGPMQKVPSLPNPTNRGCGFFYFPQEQNKCAVRRDLRFFVLIWEDWKD